MLQTSVPRSFMTKASTTSGSSLTISRTLAEHGAWTIACRRGSRRLALQSASRRWTRSGDSTLALLADTAAWIEESRAMACARAARA